MLISMGGDNNTDTFSSPTSLSQTIAVNEQFFHDFFILHQKTILEYTLQEYRTTFLYDNIPLLLGYVCIFVVGVVANCINMYAAFLQIRRHENTVCSKMFFQLALSQLLLILYIIPMDYLWRYNQVWEAGEITCKLLVWIRFYLIVTVAAFTVLQTLVRYMVMKVSIQQNNKAKPISGQVVNSNEHSAFINMAESDTTSAARLSEVSITGTEETVGNEPSQASFHWRNFLSFLSIRSSWGVSRSLSMASIIDHHPGKKKPSFKENRLIFLGWFLPMLLCVPEAFVYKLHVHDHIEGYQQCADIFVPQKELLFPRLFPTAEEEIDAPGQNTGWDYMQHEQMSILPGINQSNKLENILSTIFNESENDFKQYLSTLYSRGEMEELFFLEESIEQPEREQAMSHLKMLYYLMLQSLTFLVPVGSIVFLNVLVVRCYSTVRKESVACKCGKQQQNGNDKCQLHVIRQWAARQTMLLTMSFGISYVICWLPMSILMASKWKTIIIHPVDSSEPNDTVYDSEFTSYPLTFWTFIEEWAIAWGLLISVINPFLYGFFYINGGSKRRTMDLLNIDVNGVVDGQNSSAAPQIRSKIPRFTSIIRRQKERRPRTRGKPVPIEEKE